ncbi:hypothetical protein L9F63_004720 [Diploptera punctata]|uniref:Ciliogenesis-associated TTC17-interacting protein N-terminal domain-containing protein n=1 Tax=Diploptera punctata TaxID=6984 RepID=A0AAD8E7E5_DIPPU|nr:hypothetical protein L9F63_004720 [Diploptera punctata]
MSDCSEKSSCDIPNVLEQFYVDEDAAKALLFREELEIVLQSNPQAVSGMFTLSVRLVEDNLMIHISGQATLDDTLECSTSITSCITKQLCTIDEHRTEHTQLDIGYKEQKLYLGRNGSQYYCVTQLCVNNDILSQHNKHIPISQLKDFISEGANVILLRQMALKGFVGELNVNTMLIDGRICSSKYLCDGSTVISRNDEKLTVYVIKRIVQETSDEQQILMSTLTAAGQLLEHEWVGGLSLVRASPYKKVSDQFVPLEHQWQRDLQLTSCYLDYKSQQLASYKSYCADRPEVNALISDFIQALLLIKPDSVIEFAVSYFSTFKPDTGEMERVKLENKEMMLHVVNELLNLTIKNIAQHEVEELVEDVLETALSRVESQQVLMKLQNMIQSASRLVDVLEESLKVVLEDASEVVISEILNTILHSAIKLQGDTKVAEVLNQAATTKEAQQTLSSIMKSVSQDRELIMSSTDTESKQIVNMIISDLLDKVLVIRILFDEFNQSSGKDEISHHIFIQIRILPDTTSYEHVECFTVKSRDPELVKETYQTCTGEFHNWKHTAHTDTDAVPKPVLCTRQQNARNIFHKLQLKPWIPLVFGESEYSAQFVHKESAPILHIEQAPAAISICKSRGLGRDEQPPVPRGPNSFAKHLDPYISTTHLCHTRFTNAELYGIASNDIITMYTADVSPEISRRREPVYDKLMFKNQKVVRVIPRTSCPVPHKGMTTEVQVNYRNESSSKTWDSGAEFPVTIPPATAPNTYCTEYCHVGTGWPIRAAVNISRHAT